ncbi:MAG TPA: glycosyltransferase family 2 protein [Myxococcales bacterium]
MLVSVLLPARNASATIREAASSILQQRDAPPFEVVCVDDASTDGTATHLPPEVRVVRGCGKGLVEALNLGLAHCRGDFIARMDADDIALPDRLRLQIELLRSNERLGAVGCLVECFPPSPGLSRLEAWLNRIVTPDDCKKARFIEAPLVHPSTTYRRKALGHGWEDHGWAEDWDLLLRLDEQGWQLAKVPQVLLRWRDSEERLTRTGAAYSPQQLLKLRAHYLARGPLRGRRFSIWGAGPTGKRLARELEAHGLRPEAFFDVDRNKAFARGRPVYREDKLPERGSEFIVAAVGAAGARDEIRSALNPRGYREGDDYLFAC